MNEIAATVASAVFSNLVVSNVVVHALNQKSTSLANYYDRLKMIAVCLDVTSVTWGVLLAQMSTDGVLRQMLLAVLIQTVHDVLFGMFIRSMHRLSPTLKLFRAYADEHGRNILLVDAMIMIIAVIVSHIAKNWSLKANALFGTLSLYIHLLALSGL